jgi:hypothetical protein
VDPLIAVLLAAAIVATVILGLRAAAGRRLRELQGRYEDVLSEHGLTMTDRPGDLSDEELAAFAVLPGGDRTASALWGASGQELVRLGDQDERVTCAAFEWCWETWVATSRRPGYERSSRMTAVVVFDREVTADPSLPAKAAARLPGAEIQVQGRALVLALPTTPRGIVRLQTSSAGQASTASAPIDALPEIRQHALALATALL